MAQEPDAFDLSTAVQLAVLARFYERIGDHAVTIGERVRYLVTGAITERDARVLDETRAVTVSRGPSP